VIGHADADGAPLRVLQPTRGLARGRQQERERSRGRGLEQPELPGIDARIAPDLAQVAAHQREVMVPVGPADAAQTLERLGIADVTAQRIAGIGRVGNDAPGAHDFGGAANQSQLRIEVCRSKYWLMIYMLR
jgi:hypothetical protein